MDDPEAWRWIWMIAAFVFVVGEISTAGTFFLLPFGIGAAVAALLAFGGVGITWQWVAFVGLALVSFALLRPLARRLDVGNPSDGFGARRLIGAVGTVIEAADGNGEQGLVRIQREEWNAESVDGSAIATDTRVRVVEVRGTRVLVAPVDDAVPPTAAD